MDFGDTASADRQREDPDQFAIDERQNGGFGS
jgi:hypothetical protein